MGLTIKSTENIFATSFICVSGILLLKRMFKFPNKLIKNYTSNHLRLCVQVDWNPELPEDHTALSFNMEGPQTDNFPSLSRGTILGFYCNRSLDLQKAASHVRLPCPVPPAQTPAIENGLLYIDSDFIQKQEEQEKRHSCIIFLKKKGYRYHVTITFTRRHN